MRDQNGGALPKGLISLTPVFTFGSRANGPTESPRLIAHRARRRPEHVVAVEEHLTVHGALGRRSPHAHDEHWERIPLRHFVADVRLGASRPSERLHTLIAFVVQSERDE